MSQCVKALKEKNNKLTSFCIDDILLKKHTWTNIGDLKKY